MPIGDICYKITHPFTYDHRIMKIRLPVRSAIYKHDTGGLVVRWVTTSESPLLYVFDVFCPSFLPMSGAGRWADGEIKLNQVDTTEDMPPSTILTHPP